MSVSRISRRTRLVIRIASFGLAGLLAGLLSGCSGTETRAALAPNDTGWMTPSTYASAVQSLPPRNAVRSGHLRLCSGAPCPVHAEAERILRGPHRVM